MEKLNFGPFVCKTNINEELKNELLKEAHKQKVPHNKYLVGRIDNEKSFTKELQSMFKPRILEYIREYYAKLIIENKFNLNINEIGFELEDMWVNFQKSGEYNPPHGHFGDISFVIYVNIPEEIKEEKNYTNGYKNASITFMYGTPTNLLDINGGDNLREPLYPITTINHLPITGEMFIFPSYLIHYVEAFFTKDVERISIAGNVTIFDSKIKSLI